MARQRGRRSPSRRSARRNRVADLARRREHEYCVICDAEGPRDDEQLRDLGWWFVLFDLDDDGEIVEKGSAAAAGEGGAQVCPRPECKAEAVRRGFRAARRHNGDPIGYEP